ncbi:MAG: hypothetical protein PHI75_00530 [Bacilli bacterium]|nr:hypothetical protein [Bacilli bacterium]MDD3841195.1 hypothetical protein [Bacilli bacterium]HKM10078.1 hypothetical protein [Bacilli bacterium]
MKIELEGKKSLISLIPGFYQFGPNESFSPCALGLTENSLIVYNDYAPDEIRQDAFLYRIKKEVNLSDLKTIITQKIKHSSDIDRFNRLNIIQKEVENSFFVYYLKKDKTLVKNMLKKIKQAGLTIKKMSICLSSNA